MNTVYITGASAGLGRAIAEAFLAGGYRVGLVARDGEALADMAGKLGSNAAWAAADVSDFRSLEAAALALEGALGPPDIWVNDAMATIFSRFDDITPAEFAQATKITYLGAVHGLMIALKYMKARKRGHIIQIGSALAYRAIPLQAPYCAAKHAIRGAVNSLRCELIHDKSPVRVTMVHMPAMNTPQFDWARRHIAKQPQPVPPIYAPEACAKAVVWAAKRPSRREVWVGKPTFEAILGNKLFPCLLDYYLAKMAYDGQFERPAPGQNSEGNLFRPVPGLHQTEGHFADRQRGKVFWIGTSWWQEALVLAAVIASLSGMILFLIFK